MPFPVSVIIEALRFLRYSQFLVPASSIAGPATLTTVIVRQSTSPVQRVIAQPVMPSAGSDTIAPEQLRLAARGPHTHTASLRGLCIHAMSLPVITLYGRPSTHGQSGQSGPSASANSRRAAVPRSAPRCWQDLCGHARAARARLGSA